MLLNLTPEWGMYPKASRKITVRKSLLELATMLKFTSRTLNKDYRKRLLL